MNAKTVRKKYGYSHTSWARGYQSIEHGETVRKYRGRFGEGYVIDIPSRFATTKSGKKPGAYHLVEYWVK